jgi:hypothetical protein
MKTKQSLIYILTLALLPIFAGRCAFGDEASALDEERSLTQYLLAVAGANGTGNLRLRFGDGGTDQIDTFANPAGAVVLGDAVWLDIEKIEIYAGQTSTATFPLAPLTYYFERFWLGVSRGLVSPLGAHDEGVTPAPGVTIAETGQNTFAAPLSAGTNGNGQDSLGRFYYQVPEISVSLPPGGIQRIIVHVRRMQFNGTIGGNPFSVLYQVKADFATTPRCNGTIRSHSATGIDLFFDYALLFRDLPAASSAGVTSAFGENIHDGGILNESECFGL